MSPRILVVSGLPASGKTTLATHLAHELGLPLVTKDEYKAIVLDAVPDALKIPLTRQAGKVSFSLMWHVAGVILAAGQDIVLETHFYRPQSEGHILTLAGLHRAALLQIFCEAPLPELKRRHAARVASGKRPGIDLPFDHEKLPPSACWEALELPGPLLRLDTTAPEAHARALAWVRDDLDRT